MIHFIGSIPLVLQLAAASVPWQCIGRKNYLFAGSPHGARRTAMLYSFLGDSPYTSQPLTLTFMKYPHDHLGNVRAVIGSPETETIPSDFEAATNGDFQNYSRQEDDLMNHTTPGLYSQLLNGGYNGRIGLAKSLEVSPGDVIKVEAYGKYRDLDPDDDLDLCGFATALTGAFGLTAGMPGDPWMAYDALDDYGDWIGAGNDHSDDENSPLKAYVNVLLFDKNYNLVDAAYRQLDDGAEQVGMKRRPRTITWCGR